MTLEELTQEEQSIAEMVDRSYVDPTGKADPIYDGVISPADYLTAPRRILWILKEPWDEADCSGGGWSLAQAINENPTKAAKGHTFPPIVYVAYGILNQVSDWNDMPQASEVADVLRSIAFINAKKLPGLTRADNNAVFQAYLASSDLIFRQISAYQPHYIFGCRPHMPAIMEHFGVVPDSIVTHNSVQYAKHDSRTFFYVHHPAQTQISQERYVNDILEAVTQAA